MPAPAQDAMTVRRFGPAAPQDGRERPMQARPEIPEGRTRAAGTQAQPDRRPTATGHPVPGRAAPGAQPRPGNWVRDSRHGHARFYPSIGYSVASLPPAHVSVGYSGSRYYFHYGTWYRPGPAGYVVVRPPLGIVVPVMPPFFTSLWFGSTLYYYANDIYYLPVAGGYAVVDPPAEQVVVPAQAAPAPAPEAGGPYPEGTWYYCEAAGNFHPYVTECPEGWQPVPAVPPDLLDRLSSVPSYPEGTWYYCDSERTYYPYVSACPQGWRPVPATSQAQPATR
jgi:hypothetical protein